VAKQKQAKMSIHEHLPWWATIMLGFVGLAISYSLGSRAIESGSLLQYGGCLIMFVLSIRLFIISVKKQTHGSAKR
jgi:hypothetical protein